MDLDAEDTIVAIASPRQGGARGIIRISGPGTLALLEARFRTAGSPGLAAVRQAQVVTGQLDGGPSIGWIDGQLYWWPTRASYTRQAAAEFHTWGCVPLLEAMAEHLCSNGARLAAPGEFTLRAFLAGRLDLTQAEAVLGVIDAVDRQQLDTALRQLAGGLTHPLRQLRERLLDLLADLEAGLDFADEDIHFIDPTELSERLAEAAGIVDGLAARLRGRTAGDDRPLVVLVGMPNVGKSTLCNVLWGRDQAMVSEVAGTTRDFLVAPMVAGGLEVRLADTAGLMEGAGEDPLHRAAEEASRRMFEQADLRILCLDASRPLLPWERGVLATDDARRMVVRTKCDLAGGESAVPRAVDVSARSGQGLEALRRAIRDRLQAGEGGEWPAVESTALRCTESLRLAAECLEEARGLGDEGGQEELVAGLVRGALDQLGLVVGQVYTEDLLDRIFGRFCIGK